MGAGRAQHDSRTAHHRIRPDLFGVGAGWFQRVPVLRLRTPRQGGWSLRRGAELRRGGGAGARKRHQPQGFDPLELHGSAERQSAHRRDHALFGHGAPHAGQLEQHLRRVLVRAHVAVEARQRRPEPRPGQLLRPAGVRHPARKRVPVELRELAALRGRHQHQLHADRVLPPRRNLRHRLHLRRRGQLPSLPLECGRLLGLDARRQQERQRGPQPRDHGGRQGVLHLQHRPDREHVPLRWPGLPAAAAVGGRKRTRFPRPGS